MAELKTQKNDESVEKFLSSVDDDKRRDDCRSVMDIMKRVTGAEAVMWGKSIIGLDDVDTVVLEDLIFKSVAHVRASDATSG